MTFKIISLNFLYKIIYQCGIFTYNYITFCLANQPRLSIWSTILSASVHLSLFGYVTLLTVFKSRQQHLLIQFPTSSFAFLDSRDRRAQNAGSTAHVTFYVAYDFCIAQCIKYLNICFQFAEMVRNQQYIQLFQGYIIEIPRVLHTG